MPAKPFDTYFGGKEAAGAYQKIINEIRPHEVFVSAFLGNCAVLRHMAPSPFRYGIDLDNDVVRAWGMAGWGTLCRPEQDLPKGTPGTRESPSEAVRLIHGPAQEWLPRIINHPRHEGQRIVVYCDPPYMLRSRKSGQPRYACEMTDVAHLGFLNMIEGVAALPNVDVIVSHYPDPVYDDYLEGWRTVDFRVATRQGGAAERLYCNFSHTDGKLHDYRYVGEGKHERYRLRKRMAAALIGKLAAMEPRKRQAMLHWLAAEVAGMGEKTLSESPVAATDALVNLA